MNVEIKLISWVFFKTKFHLLTCTFFILHSLFRVEQRIFKYIVLVRILVRSFKFSKLIWPTFRLWIVKFLLWEQNFFINIPFRFWYYWTCSRCFFSCSSRFLFVLHQHFIDFFLELLWFLSLRSIIWTVCCKESRSDNFVNMRSSWLILHLFFLFHNSLRCACWSFNIFFVNKSLLLFFLIFQSIFIILLLQKLKSPIHRRLIFNNVFLKVYNHKNVV